MTFPVDDILLGPATFGRLHRLDGAIVHTGEEPGFSRDLAVATAVYQATHPGSYNFRVYDRATDPRGVMLNVPYLEASGGINPASTFWAPGRFPFLRDELAKAGPCPKPGCAGPYLNPTMHHLQVSFVGRTADLDAGRAPANYIDDARLLLAWMETLSIRGPAPLVISKHAHWQTNRSDCGEWAYSRLAPQLVQEGDDMSYLKGVEPIVNRRAIIKGGATIRSAPRFDRTDYDAGKLFSIPADSTSNAPIIAWVTGSNLTLADGTVYDPSTRWAAIQGKPYGVAFVHERDVSRLVPIETIEVSTGITPEQLAADKYAAALEVARVAGSAAEGYKP